MTTTDPRATGLRRPTAPPDDYYPLTTATSSARSVRAAGARRDYGEAPDVSRDWFDSDEDYEAWVAEGCIRFFEVI